MLTHLAVLKPALQASGQCGPLGSLGPLGPLGPLWLLGPGVWFVIHLRLRLRPEGPISDSPGRSPGSGAPKKLAFRSEGPISRRACFRFDAPGFQVLTHLAFLKTALQG